MPALLRSFLTIPLFLTAAAAAPLSQQSRIDFYRDVPSRNLDGLATRSDGRLTAGPVLRELTGDLLGAELLWTLTPGPEGSWFIGTGPQGRILHVKPDAKAETFTAIEWAKVDDAQIYALHRLPDGSLLAGTSPQGGLHLLRDGVVVASIRLPVDSIFDILPGTDDSHVIVGTGNPGRIYRVNIARLAQAGVVAEPLRDAAALTAAGVERLGDIRDRNVRRLARAQDGRILAGSSPSGKLYAFAPDGGRPELLLDNSRAEITDLRVESDGGVLALVVHSSSPGPIRPARGGVTTPTPTPPPTPDTPHVPTEEESDVPAVERFSGRSSLVWLPRGDGFPETLASRANIALYRIQPRGELLIMAGGDAGEIVGYDRTNRRSLTFEGSSSAQLSQLVPLSGDRFLVLRNNPGGLAVLDFAATGPRRAETRRIDLRTPGLLGALRFNRLRGIEPQKLNVSLRTNRAEDEAEGWTSWRPTTHEDGAWRADDLRGRYAQVRIELPETLDPQFEIDAATLFHLPQNRRPVLQSFRIISPNFGLLPRPESPSAPILTLGQVIGSSPDSSASERRSGLLNSQLVPQPGAQVVYWTLDDPDGDELAATFSIRREGTDDWIDVAVNRTEPWAQFDRSHLPDGVYFTRLQVREQAPRAPADRLEVTLQTDDLVIDQTPPQIQRATIEREGERLLVRVTGNDALSLLAGIEVVFNNGREVAVEQPLDDILDGRNETFVAEVPAAEVANATSVEVLLYDQAGNSSARRLELPKR